MSSSSRSKSDGVGEQLQTREKAVDTADEPVAETAVESDPLDRVAEPGDGGFDFETEPKHHDPVVRMTEAFERDEITAELLETADTDALKTFVVRAEAGEFDVRADPALEAAVRIARSLVYEQTRP